MTSGNAQSFLPSIAFTIPRRRWLIVNAGLLDTPGHAADAQAAPG